MAAKINRTGKTYGDLTVLETILGSNSKTDTYLVKCNCCGNTMIIGIDALLKGLKCKNCRDKDRKSTYQDLIGKECNGIKVVSLAEDAIGRTGHRDIRYNCLCSCGKEFVAYRSSLLQGKVKSCGCRKHITEASKMLKLPPSFCSMKEALSSTMRLSERHMRKSLRSTASSRFRLTETEMSPLPSRLHTCEA